MPTIMETKSSTDSDGTRRSGEAPARPPRPPHLTVPNLINSSLSKAKLSVKIPDTTVEQDKLLQATGIAFHRTERATKFTYSAETGKWEMQAAKFKIAKESFAEGGMRRSYRAMELTSDNNVVPLVVKLFKDPKTKPAVVFHEALTQAVAERYAQGFNNLCERQGLMLRIKFLPVWVLHLTERSMLIDGFHHDTYATVEPFLPGSYVKLSDNSGRHLNDIPAQAAQTFSHYTFLASGRRLVCVDIQGVSELAAEIGGIGFTAKTLSLTDPQIHSLDGNMFGSGNLGVGGINAFISSYKRTMFDEQLGLAHLGPAMMIETKKLAVVNTLPAVAEAPPFDTAELATRLSEDERLARLEEAEEDDEVASLPVNPQSIKDEEELKLKMGQVQIGNGSARRMSARERHSQRITDFASGGEVARLSMKARELTLSISDI